MPSQRFGRSSAALNGDNQAQLLLMTLEDEIRAILRVGRSNRTRLLHWTDYVGCATPTRFCTAESSIALPRGDK